MKEWCARHFRGAWWLWCGLVSAVTLAIEFYFLARSGEAPVLGLVCSAVLGLFAGLFWLNRLTRRRCSRAAARLDVFCDPGPLLAWAEEQMLYWNDRRCKYAYWAALLINRAAALHALGRFDEMHGTLLDVDAARLKPPVRAVYLVNLSSSLLNLGRTEEAEGVLAEAGALLSAPKLPPRVRADCGRALEADRCALLLARGEAGGLEARLDRLLEDAGCAYRRVAAHMSLAELHLSLDEPARARPHLEYVLAHGNKLHLRAKAEALLSPAP